MGSLVERKGGTIYRCEFTLLRMTDRYLVFGMNSEVRIQQILQLGCVLAARQRAWKDPLVARHSLVYHGAPVRQSLEVAADIITCVSRNNYSCLSCTRILLPTLEHLLATMLLASPFSPC